MSLTPDDLRRARLHAVIEWALDPWHPQHPPPYEARAIVLRWFGRDGMAFWQVIASATEPYQPPPAALEDEAPMPKARARRRAAA